MPDKQEYAREPGIAASLVHGRDLRDLGPQETEQGGVIGGIRDPIAA
jgi:hypothetical protein